MIERREERTEAGKMRNLSTETVECTALALEGVDNIEGGDSLACEEVSNASREECGWDSRLACSV